MAIPPTSPPAPRPSAPRGELGAKLELLLKHNRPRALRGRGRVVAALLLLAGGGMLVQSLLGGNVSPMTQAVRDRERASTTSTPPAEGPEAGAAPIEDPEPAPASAPSTDATLLVGSAGDLALAVSRAPAKERTALRLVALTAYGEMLRGAAHRRAALEAAARLTGETVPEEAELWARVTQGALAALSAPADAGAAVLYLSSLFDRGGLLGVAALERIVEDEGRPLELRVAAARALPPGARAGQASRIGSRANPHPALLSALR